MMLCDTLRFFFMDNRLVFSLRLKSLRHHTSNTPTRRPSQQHGHHHYLLLFFVITHHTQQQQHNQKKMLLRDQASVIHPQQSWRNTNSDRWTVPSINARQKGFHGVLKPPLTLHGRYSSWMVSHDDSFEDDDDVQQQHQQPKDGHDGDNEIRLVFDDNHLFSPKKRNASTSRMNMIRSRLMRNKPQQSSNHHHYPPFLGTNNSSSSSRLHQWQSAVYASTLAAATTSPLSSGTTAAATAGGSAVSSFIRYLLVFTAGGLFFSTAIAGAYAFYGLGVDNTKRIVAILVLVWGRIWRSFTTGLETARLALLAESDNVDEEEGGGEETTIVTSSTEEGPMVAGARTEGTKHLTTEAHDSGLSFRKKWKWAAAWDVLKEQLVETRRTAAEGVQALRQEATLYGAVVGQPALVPVQYAIQKLMPYSLTTILEGTLQDSLKNMQSGSKSIKKMTLSSFTAGTRAPILKGARIYDVEDAIAFDCDVQWQSQVEATVQLYTVGGLARVPVSISRVSFAGVVRIILTPLTQQPPGYGAMLLSLPVPPQISLDVKILGGEVTKLPFLRTEITSAFQKAIANQLLWPRRSVIPTMDGRRIVVDRQQLERLESHDPLLEAEQRLVSDDTNQQSRGILREIREEILPSSPKDPFLLSLRLEQEEGDSMDPTINTTSGSTSTELTATNHDNNLSNAIRRRFHGFPWINREKNIP